MSQVLVTPLHHYYSPSHLVEVIGKMQNLGPPVLRAYFDEEIGAWHAREGTHRLRAAKALGLAPILVPVPWKRSKAALERCRFASLRFGHFFEKVEVKHV